MARMDEQRKKENSFDDPVMIGGFQHGSMTFCLKTSRLQPSCLWKVSVCVCILHRKCFLFELQSIVLIDCNLANHVIECDNLKMTKALKNQVIIL